MSRLPPKLQPQDVGERLLESFLQQEARRRRRPPTDLSPEAVGRRLRRVSELRDLCLALGRATRRAAAPP